MGDEETFDLYADLDEALIEPLQEEVEKKAAEERAKLQEDEKFREETEKIITQLKASNFQLKKNISLLLATAKSEIERKDQQIKDLRREMDEIIFRKNKGPNKKLCEKWTQTDKIESFQDQKVPSNQYNDASKSYDKNKPNDIHESKRRRISPDRKYSDDYRRSNKDKASTERNKNYDNYKGRSRKSSHEKTKSRSPERLDRHDKKGPSKSSLREDDLRKTLLKNKKDEKSDIHFKEKERQSSSDKSSKRDEKLKEDDKEIKRKDKKKERDRSRDRNKRSENSSNKLDKVEKIQKESKELEKSEDYRIKKPKTELTEVSKKLPECSTKVAEKFDEEILTSNLNLSAESEKSQKEACLVDEKSAPIKIEEINPVEFELSKLHGNMNNNHSMLTNGCKIDENCLKVEPKIVTEHPQNNSLKIEATSTEISKSSASEIKEEPVNIPINGKTDHSANLSTESADNSFGSTKENSIDNSMDVKKNKKRKIVTTVENDGTVVWTISRKKRKIKEHS